MLIVSLLTALLAGCGSESGDGAGGPPSAATDYEKALAGSPPALAELHRQGSRLLPGGKNAFEERVADLRGHPVVVNKWASWCGPCRAEFPYFQRQAAERGSEIAFLGVNSNDSEAAAETFLEQYPVPYPSYLDPESEIAQEIEVGVEFPATVFFDRQGEIVYAHRGGYQEEADLVADIERHVE